MRFTRINIFSYIETQYHALKDPLVIERLSKSLKASLSPSFNPDSSQRILKLEEIIEVDSVKVQVVEQTLVNRKRRLLSIIPLILL